MNISKSITNIPNSLRDVCISIIIYELGAFIICYKFSALVLF